LEAELFAIPTPLADVAEDVGKGVRWRDVLPLVELSNHFFFDFVSGLGLGDVVGNLGGWWTLPVHQVDDLGRRVERNKEANNLGT